MDVLAVHRAGPYAKMSYSKRPVMKSLQDVDLTQELVSLPLDNLRQFGKDHEKVKGFVQSSQEARDHRAQLCREVNTQVEMLSKVMSLLEDYKKVSGTIQYKLKQLDGLQKEFLDLETTEYQLLAANFNSNAIESKLGLYIDQLDQRSQRLAQDLSTASDEITLHSTLKAFQEARREYHLLAGILERIKRQSHANA